MTPYMIRKRLLPLILLVCLSAMLLCGELELVGGSSGQKSREQSSQQPQKERRTPKVSFLFLTTGGMNEDLWSRWFPMDEDRHSIFVHSVPAKDGVVPLGPYFCPYAIPSLDTRWCDLHNAMMQTLLHAYHHDPDAKQFIFVSTTSIPLVSFDELYDSLIADGDKSRICFTHPNAAQRIFKEYHVELGLQLNQTGKAEMWFGLSRRHVKILLRSRDSMDYWNTKFQFHGIGCPDETMIPTALLHQIDASSELKQCTPVGPDSLNTCCTHAVFWRETAIAYHGADLKKTSIARNHSLLRSLVSDDCENAPCNIRKVI